MRLLLPAVAAGLLVAACSAPWSSSGSGAPAARASATPAEQSTNLTGDACRALTAGDVQAAVGTQVTQLPMTSLPPGSSVGGTAGTMISGCNYSSQNPGTVAGASLYLYRDMPIDYFANLPGYERLPGVGDGAYLQSQASMVLGRKGHTTFQLVLISNADPATKDQKLRTLARSVASRL